MEPIQSPSGGGDNLDTSQMPPVGNIDPGGLQSASTVSSAVGLGLVATSSSGDTVASLLRLATHPSEIVTAGLSLASIGRVSLFTAGLLLIAIGILLNVASLVIRRQNHSRDVAICQREIERRARLLAERLKGSSTQGGQPPGYPTRPNG